MPNKKRITNSISCESPGETSEVVVILLWVIAQRVAGSAPAEGEEGAGRPRAARLDV